MALVHSPLSSRRGEVEDGLIYITDWLATLLAVAGLPAPPGLDSLDMWPLLAAGGQSPRQEVILSLDQDTEAATWTAVLRSGSHKLVWGQEELLKQQSPEDACRQRLYNVVKDPGEERDLLEEGPKRALAGPMRAVLMAAVREMVAADYPRQSPAGDPALNGGVLATDWC